MSEKYNFDHLSLEEILVLPRGPLDVYRSKASFDWRALRIHLEPEYIIRLKYKIWKIFENEPVFQRYPWTEMTREEYRKITFLRLRRLYELNIISLGDYLDDPTFVPAFIQCLLQYDTSLGAKRFMSMDNFMQVFMMNENKTHQALLDDISEFKAMGALTITEMGHGSNVRGLKTCATYNSKNKSFILNTPDLEATKVYSGVLGQTATHAIVYMQLYTEDNKCHGLHQFLVPIRDPKTLLPYPGIIVGDMGPKVGMDGMDNGFVQFKNYEIPKSSLLSKHGEITDDGKYLLKAKSRSKTHGASLGILSLGRISLTYVAILNLQLAIVIAIRYSAVRKQFGPPNKEEWPILEYPTHQWRLFPYLASCYVLQIFYHSFYEDYINFYASLLYEGEKDLSSHSSEIHAISCASKAVVSWIARDGIQEAREACGGHGYLKAARLDEIRRDNDANNTHEGDSNVILMQTSNYLLKAFEDVSERGLTVTSPSGSVNFINVNHLEEKMPSDVMQMGNIISIYQFLLYYLLAKAKEKLIKEYEKHKDDYRAKANCQVYLLRTLSIAFFECIALERFKKHVEVQVNHDYIPVMKRLGLLFGLTCLEKHISILYDAGYITVEVDGLKKVRNSILMLCEQLKNDAVALVDVLAPTDFILNSCLGYSDGEIYNHIFESITKSKNSMKRPDWYKEFTEFKPRKLSKL